MQSNYAILCLNLNSNYYYKNGDGEEKNDYIIYLNCNNFHWKNQEKF